MCDRPWESPCERCRLGRGLGEQRYVEFAQPGGGLLLELPGGNEDTRPHQSVLPGFCGAKGCALWSASPFAERLVKPYLRFCFSMLRSTTTWRSLTLCRVSQLALSLSTQDM